VVVGEGVGLRGKKLKLKQVMLGKDANQLRGNYMKHSKRPQPGGSPLLNSSL